MHKFFILVAKWNRVSYRILNEWVKRWFFLTLFMFQSGLVVGGNKLASKLIFYVCLPRLDTLQECSNEGRKQPDKMLIISSQRKKGEYVMVVHVFFCSKHTLCCCLQLVYHIFTHVESSLGKNTTVCFVSLAFVSGSLDVYVWTQPLGWDLVKRCGLAKNRWCCSHVDSFSSGLQGKAFSFPNNAYAFTWQLPGMMWWWLRRQAVMIMLWSWRVGFFCYHVWVFLHIV